MIEIVTYKVIRLFPTVTRIRLTCLLLAIMLVLVTGTNYTSYAANSYQSGGDIIIYGANGYNLNDIFKINLSQNSAQQVGDLAFSTQAIDQDPETGYVYYYEWRTDANEFAYWDPATGTNTVVRTYSPRPGFYGHRLAFAPDGTLYLMDDTEKLYIIDKNNGNITTLGQVTGLESGPYGGIGDFAFSPDGTLYVVLYRSLYTIDLQTMSATLLYSNMINVQKSGVLLWSGLAYCDGLLYASHIEEATGRSAIFSIDPTTGQETQLFYLPTFVNDLSSCPTNTPSTNAPPVANDKAVTTDEDTAVSVSLTASDGDGDTLTFNVVGTPANGALSGTAPNLTYTPNAGYTGSDSFTFKANDGTVDSNVATVSITVNPVAQDDIIIYGANGYDFNEIFEINLSQNNARQTGNVAFGTQAIDQDPETGYLYYYEWRTDANEFAYWNPATATSTIVRTYSPNPGFYAKRMAFAPDGTLYLMDSQERLYIINKSNGNITSLGQVTGLETGELGGTGDFAFAPDGTLYVATYRSLYTLDLQTKKATLLYTNMLDIPVSGRIVWTGLAYCNSFLYGSHAEEATGLSAIFRIDPATGQEILLFYLSSVLNDLSSCAVTTPSSNIPPVANDQSLTTAEDTPVTVTLTANDANSDPLSFNIITSPTNGVLSGSAPNLTYTPNAGFSGSDSFIFKANDGTADSNTATVTITVAPTNDAPVADNQNVSTAEDTPVTVTLTANDANSDPLSFNIIASPTNGVLSGSAPNLTYTPNAGFSGSDSFTFKANDGTADSNIATVSITVNAEAQNNIIIYGANGYNQNDLFEIDLTQNSAEQLGDLAFGTQAIDQDPETGYVYYYEWRTDAKEFAYWNPTTGTSTIVRTYSPKPGFYGHRMAFAPDGTLYMMDDQERLYTIDKSNGNITSLGQVTGIESGPYGGIGDFAFAPNGTLYVVLYRSLYTLDIQTRTATLLYDNMIDVQVSGVLLWSGLAYCDSSLYAAHIEEATGRSAIFRIDPATGQESQLFYLPTFVNDLSSCSANE